MSSSLKRRIREEVGPPPIPADLPDLAGDRIEASKWDLSEAGRRAARKSPSNVPLPNLSALSRLWADYYEELRSPGRELLEAVLASGDLGVRDRRVLKSRLDMASNTPSLVKRQVPKYLRASAKSAESQDERFACQLILGILEESKTMAKISKQGGALMVPSLEEAHWLLENLEFLLQAYWALVKTYEDGLDWLVKRYGSFQEMCGFFKGPGSLSDDHTSLHS